MNEFSFRQNQQPQYFIKTNEIQISLEEMYLGTNKTF
jgi:hypothetical protein